MNPEETPLIIDSFTQPSRIQEYNSTLQDEQGAKITTRIRNTNNRICGPWCQSCTRKLRNCKAWFSNCVDWKYIGNTTYNWINVLITADIVTDTLVLYNFYQNKQMMFFWIGLTIIIIAQICYTIVFYDQYVVVQNNHNHGCLPFFWFFIAIVFSPFLSFVFFLQVMKTDGCQKLLYVI